MRLNVIAPINQLGYGIVGLNLVKSLRAADHEVALFPVAGSRPECPDADRILIDQALLNARFYDRDAVSLKLWQADLQAEHVGRGPRWGFPFFEIDPLKRSEVHHLNQLDGVLVASDWGREVALRSGVQVPIKVAPLGVDRTIFHEQVRADRLLPDTTVFFTVGKFELRKGHDLLVEAFNAAFEPGDRVALRMLSLNPFLGARNNEWIARFKTSKLGAKIEIYPQRLQTQAEVAQFMKAGDVGVWPARAEGFNLDLLEAMSLGMPVIATDYSAHTQFVTAANCQLLRHEGLTTAHDGIWFHGEGEWCCPSLEHLVEILRSCHRQKQTGALPRNDAGIRTAQNFSWSKFSSAITNQIGTL